MTRNGNRNDEIESNGGQEPSSKPSIIKRYSKLGFILIVVLAACFIGTAVPYFISKFGFGLPLSTEKDDFGTCRINEGFHVDCLPEFSSDDLQDQIAIAQIRCDDRNCCWDSSKSVPCFQPLPSKQFSSKVVNMSDDTKSGTLKNVHLLDKSSTSTYGYTISEMNSGHIIVDIGTPIQQSHAYNDDANVNISVKAGCPAFQGNAEAAINCKDEIFIFDIRPAPDEPELESYIRSHFGPIMISEELSQISLYMPGPRMLSLDMDGLIWNGERHRTSFLFNEKSSLYLPVILGMHPNKDWYLVWLESSYPGEISINRGTQDRPLVTWSTMGGPLKLHLLTAPDIKSLLSDQMELASGINSMTPPPVEALGYYLCRDSGDLRRFRNDFNGMTKASIPIQFDGDCIDQQLVPTAFELNPALVSTLQTELNLLKTENKNLHLSLVIQRIFNNEIGQQDGCIMETNATDAQCYSGDYNGANVMYPDCNKMDWLQSELEVLIDKFKNDFNIEPIGWQINDHHPVDESDAKTCETFNYSPRDTNIDTGIVCQHAYIQSHDSELVSEHSTYSSCVAEKFNQIELSPYQVNSVFKYGDQSYGAYTGSKVPATWEGLSKSLREILFLGLVGQTQVSMPVCGTHPVAHLDSETNPAPDVDMGLLCLRWTQLAAFMPGMRSWYKDNDFTRMPYQLAKQYQEYITWALDRRYQLLPYMRTLQLAWTTSGIPMVKPMFVDNPEMWDLWSQFKLGPDLVIAAVMDGDQRLVNVSLPSGSWFEFYSGIKYFSPSEKLQLVVPTTLYQLPVFLRGGSVITLYKASTSNPPQSMQEASQSAFVGIEVIISLECNGSPRQLNICEAKSSLDWVIDLEQDSPGRMSVSVTSEADKSGEIMISVSDSSSTRQITLITINGLTLTSESTFTLPNGVSASQCSDKVEPCWSGEQDVTILKHIEIDLLTGDKQIKWTV